MNTVKLLRRGLPLLAVAVFAAACVDDEADGGGATPPPEPVLDATFVGYSDPATRQTTCGNCHIQKQTQWVATKHASAWADLQASGHAQDFCAPCHTTGGLGNTANDTAGFRTADALGQPYYYDVQCESCHGPGAGHVTAPDDAQPLAAIVADTGAADGCGACHRDTHHPFVEEWKATRHAIADDHMTGNASCTPCHEGRGALARFDPDAKYTEQAAGPAQAITCSVCHDPHGSEHAAQLRRPVTERNLATNLCMSCHNRAYAPYTGSSRGNQGHGTQGAMVLGIAGWTPSGFSFDTSFMQSSHGSSANPNLCVTCHMENYSVTTPAGTFYATGHSFHAIPCVDAATGLPDSTQACTSLGERRFAACAASGCHATESAARSAFAAVSARIDNYVATLWIDVDGDRVLDAFPADSGLLPRVKAQLPTEINPSDQTITVGDGAEFNARMLGANLAGHPDGSHGVHNPFYAEALLIATINAVRSTYAMPAPPAEARLFTQRQRVLGLTR